MRFDMERMWTETRLKDSGIEAKTSMTQHGNILLTLTHGGAQITISLADLEKCIDMVRLLKGAALKKGVA